MTNNSLLKTFAAALLLSLSGLVAADAVINNCRYKTAGDVVIRGADVIVNTVGVGVCNAPPTTTPPASGRQLSFIDNGYPENRDVPNGPVDLRYYDPILGKFPAQGQTAYVVINTGQYIALEFNSGSASLGKTLMGEISWADASTNKGATEVAISTEEGNFNVASSCRVLNGVSAITWSVGRHNWACVLNPNTTYFVNVRFPVCKHDTCHWFVTNAGKY